MLSRRTIMTGAAAAAVVPGLARAQTPVRVPVTFSPAGTPFVSVVINGQGPYRFIVDTGADSHAIRDSLVAPLKLRFLTGTRYSGIGGTDASGFYTADDVVFGGALRQTKVLLQALPHLAPVDGLLSAGFLTDFPSELDYGAAEIRLYPAGRPDLSLYSPIPSAIETHDRRLSPRLLCDLSLDGVRLRALVDTGSEAELMLTPRVVGPHDLWDKYPQFRRAISEGVTGDRVAVRIVTMPDLRIGTIRVPSVKVSLLDPQSPSAGYDAILGSRFLRHFSLAVNAGTIALRPITP